MKTTPELAPNHAHRKVPDPWAEEIVMIIRRRECTYKVFLCSGAVVCLLLVLAIWFKWNW
jgi:hypothetical protein